MGHKKIISKLIQAASECHCESVILTFFPHPRMVLQDSEVKLLNTMEEKIPLLEATTLDNLIIHPFDQLFSRLTAEEFVADVLVGQLNIQKIIIGHDHRFGRNRSADYNDLVEFGEKYGFEVMQISAEEIDAVSVSSTKIRTALSEANIDLANQYLGYNYFLTGTVSHGKKLGRTIGFPTANLELAENYKLIPKKGVYVVQSIIGGITVFGMMNIGNKPSVGQHALTIEIHFFDFSSDLYGTTISVAILHYIRDEQKFDSIALLSQQLENDKISSLEFLKR